MVPMVASGVVPLVRERFCPDGVISLTAALTALPAEELLTLTSIVAYAVPPNHERERRDAQAPDDPQIYEESSELATIALERSTPFTLNE